MTQLAHLVTCLVVPTFEAFFYVQTEPHSPLQAKEKVMQPEASPLA